MSQSSPTHDPAPRQGLSPPQRLGLDEQIAASVIDAVLTGEFPPGAALPPERDLAETLEVNRTSLRQALARLEQMGLIVRRQGSGNVVRDPYTLTDPAVVRAIFSRLDRGFLEELVEMREGLGALIGRLAAQRAEPEDLAALDRALVDLRSADVAQSRQSAELAFFGALIRATRNRALGLLMRWVESAYGGSPEHFVAAFEDAQAVSVGLERIQQAVAERRTDDAADAVESYLHDSGRRLVASVVSRSNRRG